MCIYIRWLKFYEYSVPPDVSSDGKQINRGLARQKFHYAARSRYSTRSQQLRSHGVTRDLIHRCCGASL